MKIGVVGSRSFTDFWRMVNELDKLDLSVTDVIVSGGCPKGADYLAERYARYRKHPVKIFPADWNKYGKAAGLKRNLEIIDYCDMVVVFWDGISRGSAHVISNCMAKGKPVNIIFFSEVRKWKIPQTK